MVPMKKKSLSTHTILSDSNGKGKMEPLKSLEKQKEILIENEVQNTILKPSMSVMHFKGMDGYNQPGLVRSL